MTFSHLYLYLKMKSTLYTAISKHNEGQLVNNPQWGTADAEIKVLLLRNPELTNILHLEPGAGQNIATHALPTATNFFLVLVSTFPVHSPSCFSSESSHSVLTALVLANAVFRRLVLRNKIGHPGQGHKQFKQVPSVSTCGIYEVCLKSNGTGVTNHLFQFQTTKLHDFPFKVIPLESNALFHPSLPRFYALLEGFVWDAPQLRGYGPLDGLHAFKTGPLDDPFELGEKKKATGSKIRC